MKSKKLEKKIQRIVREAGKIKPGSVCHVMVEHEDGCRALETERLADCTCAPVIKRIPLC
jgi:hypothetical protein